MNQVEVKKLVKELNALTTKILNGQKDVSALQKGSLENTMERLYSAMAEPSTSQSEMVEPNSVTKDLVNQKQPEQPEKNSAVSNINKEMDAMFTPSAVKPEAKDVNSNLLTVNERIMFSKELFKGDENALSRSIEKLQNLNNSERALEYFKQVLKPKFTQNNYDQEVISEFKHLIPRLFI